MLNNPDDYTKARNELTRICEAFGADVPEVGSEGKALALIDSGALVYDDAARKVEYKLKAPIDIGGGKTIDVVSFGDPTQKDLEEIHRGIRVISRSGETQLDLDSSDVMTGRIIARLGGVNTGLVDRMAGRDTRALSEVFALLGFFG